MSVEPDFTSVLAKLRHAERKFEEVDDEITTWLKVSINAITVERNEDFTKHALIANFNGPAPELERWSLEFGDAITNLRDCLDHLIYVAKFETGTTRPPG